MIVFLIYLMPMLLMLSAMQFFKLRKRTALNANPVGAIKVFSSAIFSVFLGFFVGSGVGYLVMFGPSHLTGDFIGLPWFTGLPALLLGLIAMTRTSSAVGERLITHNGQKRTSA